MKIGIEAHTIEKEEKLGAGGNYLSSLLFYWRNLIPEKNQFFLYFKDRIPNDEILDSPVFIKRIALNPFGLKSLSFFYNFSLGRFAAKDRNDVLFLPFYMQPVFCKTPTVVTIHDISFRAHPEWFGWRYLAPFIFLTGRAIKRSKAIIVPSHFSKQEILKYYRVSESKINVVYLGINERFDAEKNIEKIKQVKRKYGIKEKYFFYTGSIFNRRHLAESIMAFKEIRKQHEDFQFLISGRDLTHPSQKIDALCEEVNKTFPEAVKRFRYIDTGDLKFIYQGCELFIWPSEYEGFGLPVLEAMACGVPVLTTKLASLGEVAGDAALFVQNPSSIEEIKEKMVIAINNKELKEEKARKGIIQAGRFSWLQCAKETLKIIENSL